VIGKNERKGREDLLEDIYMATERREKKKRLWLI